MIASKARSKRTIDKFSFPWCQAGKPGLDEGNSQGRSFLCCRVAIILIQFFSLAFIPILDAQQPAQSRVNPQVVAKGQSATYEVIIGGASPGRSIGGRMPSVPGLEISGNASSSSSTRIINGNFNQSVTYGFSIQANEVGTYTIPTWIMQVGGKSFRVPQASIKVVDARDAFKGVFQLDLNLERDNFYVGERINATLRLLVREGVEVRILGPPAKIASDGFMLDPLKQNSWNITKVRQEGIRYDQGTVQLVVTPIKSGQQGLQFKQSLAVRTRSRDPLFDFGALSRLNEKEIILETKVLDTSAKPLPATGRLPGFTGAVGKFNALAEAKPGEVKVGEPVTLTFRVTGQGSFDRIQAPQLNGGDDLKVYPPKIGFDAKGGPGTGVKTFEYIVIPQHEDTGHLLEVPFSYFEPERGIYVDLTRRPMEISVLPAPPGANPNLPQQVVKSKSPSSQKKPTGGARLLPIRTEPGRWKTPSDFVLLTPVFVGTQILLLALSTGLFVVRRRQLRLAGDASLRRRIAGGKAASAWNQKAVDAVEASDAGAFLDAARRTLQESVGRHLEASEAEALTFEDVRRHLESKNADETTIENACVLFDAVDLLKFGGADSSGLDLAALLECLEHVQEGLK